MKLRRFLGIAQEAFARLIGVSTRTVARWEGEGVQPNAEVGEQLEYLLALSQRLEGVIEREYVVTWLTTPNPEFLNQPPVELVRFKYGRLVIEGTLERAEWGIPG